LKKGWSKDQIDYTFKNLNISKKKWNLNYF
jgi:hypothetical protein